MTTKTSTSTGKTAAVDPRVVREYANLASKTRKDEAAFIASLAGRLEAGTVTVRVAAASIREASKTATAPTVRASHVQDIQRAHAILAGAVDVDAAPLRAVLTMATRLRKGLGAADVADTKTAELIAAKVPFPQWDEIVPKTNADKDEDGEGEGEDAVSVGKDATADDIIAAALAALRDLDDLTVTDKDAARALAKVLAVVIAS